MEVDLETVVFQYDPWLISRNCSWLRGFASKRRIKLSLGFPGFFEYRKNELVG